jgi:hypothetical protein
LLVSPKYRGCDLPVVSADTNIAETKQDMREAARSGKKEFWRRIDISRPSSSIFANVNQLLQEGDAHLSLFAKFCGAVVVQHEWALAPTDDIYPVYYDTLSIPRQHRVIALVKTIPGALGINVQPERLGLTTDIHHGYEQYAEVCQEYRLSDQKPEQFVTEGPESLDLHLVDIEPHFYKVK